MEESKIETIRKELKFMDPNLDLDSEIGQAAQFLLSSAIVGPSVPKVCEFSGLPRAVVRSFASIARQNGIWKGHSVHAALLDKNGGIDFWMDVNVVMGIARRSYHAH